MASNLDIILRAIDKASKPIGNVDDSLGRLEHTSTGLLSRGLNPVRDLLGFGIKAAVGVGAAAIAGFTAAMGASIGKAANMQQHVADIAAVMGLAKDQIQPLNDLIQKLGLDPKLKVSADEAATAIENLAKNGLSMEQIMAGAARNTVLLANATGGDFGTAANIATDVMSLFKIRAEDMKRAVDGISGVTIASKFGIEDYRLAIAQAGGVASDAGVSFEDFNAVIAAISPSFASGSDAGTSFKTFLQRLIPQSADAMDLFKQLGLQTEQNGNEFYDAAGNLKSMGEIIGILNRAFSGLTSEQRNNAFTTIFGTDAQRAAAAMANLSAEKFEELRKQIAKTDSEEQAKTRMDTLSGSLEILKGIIDSVGIAIGEKFLPFFKKWVDLIADFLTKNASDIIAWAGDFANWLNNMVETYLPPFLAKLGEWWQGLKDIIKSSGELADKGKEIIKSIGDFFKPITDLVAKFVTWKDVLIAIGLLIVYSVLPWIASFVSAWTPVLVTFAALVLAVTLIRNAWENDWFQIKEKVRVVLDYLHSRFDGLLRAITDFGPAALKEIWAFVTGNETDFRNLRQIWEVTRLTAKTLFNDLVYFVTTNYPIWRDKLVLWGGIAWQWIKDAVPVVVTKLGEWWTAIKNYVIDNYPIWKASLESWAKVAWEWIVWATPLVKTKLVEWWGAIKQWFTDNYPIWKAKIAGWSTELWAWIMTTYPTVKAKLVEWWGVLSKWFTDNLPLWKIKLGEWAMWLWHWIIDSIPTVKTKLGEWWVALKGWFTTNAPLWNKALGDWFIGAFNKIGDVVPAAIHKLGDLLENLMKWSSTSAVDGFKKGLAGLEGEADSTSGDIGGAFLKALGKIILSIIEVAIQIGTAFVFWVGQSILSWVGLDIDLWKFYDHIKTVTDNFNLVKMGGELMGYLKSGISKAWPEVQKGFEIGWSGLVGTFDSLSKSFKEHVYEPVKGAIQRIWDAIGSFDLAGKFNAVWGFLVTAFDTVSGSFNLHVYQPMKDTMGKIYSAIGSWDLGAKMGQILGFAIDKFNQIMTGGFGFFGHVWSVVESVMHRVYDAFGSWNLAEGIGKSLQTIIDKFNEYMTGAINFKDHILSVMRGVGQNIIQGIIDGINAAWQWLKDKLDWLGQIVPDWVKRALGIASPSKVFMEIGANLPKALALGIQSMADLPRRALQGAASSMIEGGAQMVGDTVSNVKNFNVNFPNVGAVDNPNQEAIRTMNLLTSVYS